MTSLRNTKAILCELMRGQLDAARFEWLQTALQTLADSEDASNDLGLYSAMAKRKLGDNRLASDTSSQARDIAVPPQALRYCDAARLTMLIEVIEKNNDPQTVIHDYYRMADEQEHIALLRGLMIFAPADYLDEIALDCGRSNHLEVLSALMLDNPYPARYYSQSAFNQMVLKALFLGLHIGRIEGLAKRANDDLSRMCESYVTEREKAFREVPVDIWLALAPYASPIGLSQLKKYLTHDNPDHRYHCCQELLQQQHSDGSISALLQQRLATDQDKNIRALLKQNLSDQ